MADKKITAEEISEKIFYSPATNDQAKQSIDKGALMIEQYANDKVREALEEIKSMCDGNNYRENSIWHEANNMQSKLK